MVAETEHEPASHELPDDERETILELYPVDDYMDATGLGLTEPALAVKDEGMEEIKAVEGECGEVPEASIAAETLKHLVMERDQETKLALSPICRPGMSFHAVQCLLYTFKSTVFSQHQICMGLYFPSLSSSTLSSRPGVLCTEKDVCAEPSFLVRSVTRVISY